MARQLILLVASVLFCGPAMAGAERYRGRLPISTPASSVSSCWPGRHIWLVAGGEADLERLAAPDSNLSGGEKNGASTNPTRGFSLVLRSGYGGTSCGAWAVSLISTPALSVSSCWPGRHIWPVAGGVADWRRAHISVNLRASGCR